MKRLASIITIILIALSTPLIFANPSLTVKNDTIFASKDSIAQVLSSGMDSIPPVQFVRDTIPVLKRNAKGLIIIDNDWTSLPPWITFRDTMFYEPAFLPVIFDGNILPENLSFLSKNPYENENVFHLISPDSTFAPLLKRVQDVRKQRYEYYSLIENMEKIKYSNSTFEKLTPVSSENISKNIIQELTAPERTIVLTTPDMPKYIPKRIYWTRSGEHKLEVAQNHISDNWHKGGISSYYVQSFQKIILNYSRDKISFNNSFEWRLGFQSTSGDTLRKVRVNMDNFRTYSVFGYKAYNNWSYTSTLEVITQFFNQYKENETKRRSAFLSPLDVNIGLGMSYNLNKSFKNNITKKVKLSLDLSPLSMNFKYVMDDKVDETSFKLDKGRNTKTSWGSLVNANLTYNFNNFLTWTSRFKYLTDYGSIVAESENKFDYSLNRYFSTSFYLYMRYDENSKKDKDLKYFQFNELLSFGLNYKW